MTTGNNVSIWRSRYLTDLGCAQPTVAWNPPAPYTDIWSPELQRSGRRWYIYFAADMNSNNVTHRIYVLRSLGRNPMGPYRFTGKLKGMADQWAIDPTVLHLAGTSYLVWSGWLGLHNRVQRLFIARMAGPLEVSGHATVISSPTFPWEQSVAPINEGPVALQRRGRTFIVFSADASWSNAYALGLLSLRGKNPMRASAWVKSPSPVFSSANGVFGPGHASFVKAGTQWWIVYHAAAFSGAGWDRNIFTQPFRWSSAGTPVFGAPRSPTSWIPLPRGTPARYTAQVEKLAGGAGVAQIAVPASGAYCAWLHFSNASGGASMEFWTADGKPQLDLTFPSTGTSPSANVGTLITTVDLHSGTNALRFAESAPDVSAQIRWVQVSPMKR